MNRKNDLLMIGEVYDKALTEATNTIPKDTFKVVSDKKPKEAKVSAKAFVQKDSGPIKATQTSPNIKEIIDPAKMTKKQLETNLYQPGKFSQKNESSGINIHMSKKFDDLFKDVMSDKLHLREDKDIETVEDVAELPELGGEEHMGGEEEGEGQSPEAIIDQIIDLLGDLRNYIGGEEEQEAATEGENEDMDLGELGAKKEDNETYAAEETELEEVKDSVGQSLQKGEKVKTSWKPPGGKAQNVSAYKQTTNDGEAKESDLHNPKKKVEVNSTVKAGRQIGQ